MSPDGSLQWVKICKMADQWIQLKEKPLLPEEVQQWWSFFNETYYILPINPTKCNLTIGREVQMRLSFFPNGSGNLIPVSTLVKDLGGSKLGRHSPGGDRVLCKSTDVTTRHIRLISRTFIKTS